MLQYVSTGTFYGRVIVDGKIYHESLETTVYSAAKQKPPFTSRRSSAKSAKLERRQTPPKPENSTSKTWTTITAFSRENWRWFVTQPSPWNKPANLAGEPFRLNTAAVRAITRQLPLLHAIGHFPQDRDVIA
jgi:hypothetical protein